MGYTDLIEHLEKHEIFLPDEPIPKNKMSKDALDTTSILKKDRKDAKPKVKFGKEAWG